MVITQNDIKEFAIQFQNIKDIEIDLLGEHVTLACCQERSINNQGEYLQEDNFFSRNLEYKFEFNGEIHYIALQLYINSSGHYRVFLMDNKGKMWTSVNLSNGFDAGFITFDIQIKVSAPQSDSTEQRAAHRDRIVRALGESGLKAGKRNHIAFGGYDVAKREFVNTSPEQFVKDIVTIGACKIFVE